MSRRVEDNSFPTHRAESLMRRAIGLTEGTLPHPNPRVGAIVVNPDGEIISERAHLRPGMPHAEAAALADAGSAAEGSTVVCTLEPCSHHGRTPPCVDAIIAAGVARVIVGTLDPDPRVSGSGLEALRAAGIDVIVGVEEAAVRANDPAYFHHRTTGRPFVTWKIALTLDGQSAAADGTARWITGPEAREDGHRLRAESDAILVGAGTVISDDPRLDVRLDGYDGPHPRPIIVAGTRPIPETAVLMSRDPLILTGDQPQGHLTGIEQVSMGGAEGVDLEAAMEYLGDLGYASVLIEGGPTLGAAALSGGIVDRVVLYYGAKFGGGTGLPAINGAFRTISEARPASIEAITPMGRDFKVEASIEGAF